jgi:WS/DGAT/MGAT family acyltransferase
VHRIALPSPADAAALSALVSDILSTPLDHGRPLWQLYVVEGVGPPIAHGTALITRVHHCLGDGVALVRVLLALSGVDAKPQDVGLSPAPVGAHVSDLAKHAAAEILALGKLTFLPFDDATELVGEQSRKKRVAWSRAIPLARVKEIARSLDAKTNDVLMASVTAAVRGYLLAHGGLPEHHGVHAIVPVFLRALDDAKSSGNHFGLVFAKLPLSCPSAIERVIEMKRRMDAIKASPEADVSFAILGVAGFASAEIERLVVELFSRKGSLLVTNVAGPPGPIELGGREVESMTVWAPTAGHVGLGISFLSYAGTVRMAVASDAALVPDPASIVQAFEADLDELFGVVAPRAKVSV